MIAKAESHSTLRPFFCFFIFVFVFLSLSTIVKPGLEMEVRGNGGVTKEIDTKKIYSFLQFFLILFGVYSGHLESFKKMYVT